MTRFLLLLATILYADWINACLTGGPQPTTTQTTTGLQAALGPNVKTKPFSTVADSSPVVADTDLFCTAWDTSCGGWSNAGGEKLDWTQLQGTADVTKWKYATGTSEMPDNPSLIMASNPRDQEDAAILESKVINCQVGEGQLDLRHWISRANSEAQRPQLSVCWRFDTESELRECQMLHDGPLSSVTIPEIVEPFKIVITAKNYVQSPQGGFIVIDDIKYLADVRQDCSEAENYDEGEEEDYDGEEEEEDTGDGDDYNPDEYDEDDYGDDDQDGGTTTEIPDETTESPEENDQLMSDEESCSILTCDFATGDICSYNPVGRGATNVGRRIGWKSINGRRNPFNPLTGVKSDHTGSRDTPFLVASFPDPRQDGIQEDTAFDLESPVVTFSENQYLHFFRYVATRGLRLRLCKDEIGFDCFFETIPVTRPSDRAWVEELVELPQGTYPIHAIASYDGSVFNRGQVAITYFEMFRDGDGIEQLC